MIFLFCDKHSLERNDECHYNIHHNINHNPDIVQWICCVLFVADSKMFVDLFGRIKCSR